MMEFDGLLLPLEVIVLEPTLTVADWDGGGQLTLGEGLQAISGGDLSDGLGGESDGSTDLFYSAASSDALAAGIVGAADGGIFGLNPIATGEEEEEQVIVITGRDGGGGGGTGPTGGEGGDTGYSGDGTGTGGTSGPGATVVEPHTQDCGTEDGAAVQVAKHVMGTLPVGVAGPADAVTTSSGNEWTEVEFGALIVKNPDGTYGAFNDAIYSNDANGWVVLPMTGVQGFQGTWHNHPARPGETQKIIDRYPSSEDWAELASLATQPGAASDPSIWLTGPDGVTREFKLSERGQFDHEDTDRLNGEGLEGRERTASCG